MVLQPFFGQFSPRFLSSFYLLKNLNSFPAHFSWNTGDLDLLLQGVVASEVGGTWSNSRVRTRAGVEELVKEDGVRMLGRGWMERGLSEPKTSNQEDTQSIGHHGLGSKG